MKSTKVRTHEDHALLLLPKTAILSQMKHKSMLRFLNVLSPLENLWRKKKTTVSRTNSAFTVANQAIWREPVTRKRKMMPDHVTLSPLVPPPPKRTPPWMKTTPVLTSPPCIMMSTWEHYRCVPSQPLSLRIFSLTYCCAVNRFPLCFLFAHTVNASLFETNDSTPVPGDTIQNIQSPSIVLRVTLVGHKSGKEISAKALLDSGAEVIIIDHAFATQHKLTFRSLLKPLPVRNV